MSLISDNLNSDKQVIKFVVTFSKFEVIVLVMKLKIQTYDGCWVRLITKIKRKYAYEQQTWD